jgi:hypothetical protein
MKFEDQDPNFFESEAQGGAPAPPCGVAGGEGGVDEFRHRCAEVVDRDEVPADVPQRGLGLAVLAGGHDGADAHVRAQGEEGQQEAALEDVTVDALVRGHRGRTLR